MKLLSVNGNLASIGGKMLAIDARVPLIITVDTTKGNGFKTFTMPLTNSVTDISVSSSDGQYFKISNYLDAERTITFATSGIYTLELRGQCGWSFNNTGDCQKLISIVSGGSFKFNYLGFGFYGCTNLTSIPYNWVINAPTITSLLYLFNNCGLTCQIPPNILSTCTNVLDVNSLFRNNIYLSGEIPPDIFRYCTKLTGANSAFAACNSLIGAIPPDIFRYNTKLTYINSLFLQCYGLTGTIPPDIFKHNTLLQQAGSVFQQCGSMSGEIPPNLLQYNINLTTIIYLFYATNFTGNIPPSLIRNNTLLTSINGMFVGGGGFTGGIPVDFIRYNIKLTNISQLFGYCTGLSGAFPSDFFAYTPLLTDVSRMMVGTKNIDITNFFIPLAVIPNITNFSSLMEVSVSGFNTGTIQDIWTYASLTATKLNAFKGQTSFTNYPSIPNNWKGL